MCGECPGRHGTGGVARIPNATNDTLMLFFSFQLGAGEQGTKVPEDQREPGKQRQFIKSTEGSLPKQSL